MSFTLALRQVYTDAQRVCASCLQRIVDAISRSSSMRNTLPQRTPPSVTPRRRHHLLWASAHAAHSFMPASATDPQSRTHI